jgi:uncharacterized protein YqeY
VADLRDRLAAALERAMRARDTAAVAALRSALAAIANAEAVDRASAELSEHPLGRQGVGATEARRRELTDGDVVVIVLREVVEYQTAADEYDRLGRTDDAARARLAAATLGELVDG